MSFNDLRSCSLGKVFYRDLKFDMKTGVVPTENAAGCLIEYINYISVRVYIFPFSFLPVL